MKFLVCLVMLICNASAILDLSGKMFTFPEETNTDHVKITPSQSSIPAVTVCHRSFTDLTRSHALFSLATPSNHNTFLTFWDENKQSISPHVSSARAYTNVDYATNKWHSICTTWDSSSGLLQLWLNGQPLTKKYINQSPINGNPIVVLGQEQDSHGGGFDINQSFQGMMTDVHMWNYVLSTCEIESYMTYQCYTPGNVVNWKALDFAITGNVQIEDKQTSCNN